MAKEKTIKREFKVESGQVPENDMERLNGDVIKSLIDIKKTFDTVPTYKPKRPDEQIYYYLNTGVYRIYFYINNEWKYIGLT